jgi:hypothetical protein
MLCAHFVGQASAGDSRVRVAPQQWSPCMWWMKWGRSCTKCGSQATSDGAVEVLADWSGEKVALIRSRPGAGASK